MAEKDFFKVFQQEKKTEFVGLRVTPQQKRNMQQNAEKVGQNLSGYLVGLDRYASEKVLNANS